MLGRAALEEKLFALARAHVPAEFFSSKTEEMARVPDMVPVCGQNPTGGRLQYWMDFLLEPADKLLQTCRATEAMEARIEYEYLSNETNILDRLL